MLQLEIYCECGSDDDDDVAVVRCHRRLQRFCFIPRNGLSRTSRHGIRKIPDSCSSTPGSCLLSRYIVCIPLYDCATSRIWCYSPCHLALSCIYCLEFSQYFNIVWSLEGYSIRKHLNVCNFLQKFLRKDCLRIAIDIMCAYIPHIRHY